MLVVYKFFYGTKERMFFKKSFLLYKDTSYILKILSILMVYGWKKECF